ncbi:hypothetical protein LCGC14_2038200 [marine sediment metagenome]|uniref:DinB-like domain-containing protein n=1 Tax=marine sediment metagenome TaxID=412755 RepID=A0A0F9HPQ9_9ZZZZ
MSRIEWPGSNAELVSQLAEQRSRYEQLVNNITDLFMLIDSDGTISFCNGRNNFCPGEPPCPKQGGKLTDCVAESDCRVVTDAVAELLAEFKKNRDATIEAFEQADEALLKVEIRSAGGIPGPLSTVIYYVTVVHVAGHVNDIVGS